jgi:nicotinamide riboside kinase
VSVARSPVITLTGPESTGKSTLADWLARRFAAPVSAEGARHYVDARLASGAPATLSYATVSAIAREQLALEAAAEREARRLGSALVLRDTDLVSTAAYARHLYGAAPTWVEAAARARRADHYLLCDVDVPFVVDDVRRDAAEDRAAIRDRFVATLREMGCRWTTLVGPWADRERLADQVVARLLGDPAHVRSAAAP